MSAMHSREPSPLFEPVGALDAVVADSELIPVLIGFAHREIEDIEAGRYYPGISVRKGTLAPLRSLIEAIDRLYRDDMIRLERAAEALRSGLIVSTAGGRA